MASQTTEQSVVTSVATVHNETHASRSLSQAGSNANPLALPDAAHVALLLRTYLAYRTGAGLVGVLLFSPLAQQALTM